MSTEPSERAIRAKRASQRRDSKGEEHIVEMNVENGTNTEYAAVVTCLLNKKEHVLFFSRQLGAETSLLGCVRVEE